ncbi:uncharacterized protein TNCV_454471 [Trichonephila clavipes]|nr:uncharacterized protein TNCV_454471 [Trichonephila clavipes]
MLNLWKLKILARDEARVLLPSRWKITRRLSVTDRSFEPRLSDEDDTLRWHPTFQTFTPHQREALSLDRINVYQPSFSDIITFRSRDPWDCAAVLACDDPVGYEAIRSLHRQLDDDANGSIDVAETDEVSFQAIFIILAGGTVSRLFISPSGKILGQYTACPISFYSIRNLIKRFIKARAQEDLYNRASLKSWRNAILNLHNRYIYWICELRASNNTALEHRTHCPSTSSELPVRVSAAGGSVIYRNLQSSTNCSEIIVNANKSCGNSVSRKHNVGVICLVDVKVEDLTLFILGVVYIHPKASAEAVKLCLCQSLLPYSANLTKLIPNSQPDLETPIVLCGDFNCDPQQNSYLVEFMRNEFGLNSVQTSPTTLGNTTIDCTFTRNINVDIIPYVSYFTYHRPMLNEIVVEY